LIPVGNKAVYHLGWQGLGKSNERKYTKPNFLKPYQSLQANKGAEFKPNTYFRQGYTGGFLVIRSLVNPGSPLQVDVGVEAGVKGIDNTNQDSNREWSGCKPNRYPRFLIYNQLLLSEG
jgi:hypothetical protein